MRLMILENKKLRAVLPAQTEVVSIGSSPQCVIHLPDPRIGHNHATIARDESGAWWLEVLDMSLPTCLNRAVQTGKAKLRHADEIEMGPFSIRLFMESEKSRDELQRERLASLSRQHGESLPLGTIARKFEKAIEVSKEQIVEMTLLAMRLGHVDAVRDLLMPILRVMIRIPAARRAWIGLRQTDHGPFDWSLGMNDQGQPCERPAFSESMQGRCLAQTQFLCCPEASAPGMRSAMAVPLSCQSGNLGLLYVENDAGDPPYGSEALDLLSLMACCVAPPVEAVIRKTTVKRQAVASSEFTIARATQDAITPKALPHWDELQVAAYRQMGSARCCDYYDIVQLPDKTGSVIVARVSADGMALSRYLAEARAAFRSCALHCDAPHMFARSLNWMISGGEGRPAVDVVAAWIAPASGKVHYCLAGPGVHLLRLRGDGTCEKIEAGRVDSVGRVKTAALDMQSMDLARGETMVFLTDGFNLVHDAGGKPFGLSGLEDSLCDGLAQAPSQLLSELATDLTEVLETGTCPDDASVVLVRRA